MQHNPYWLLAGLLALLAGCGQRAVAPPEPQPNPALSKIPEAVPFVEPPANAVAGDQAAATVTALKPAQ